MYRQLRDAIEVRYSMYLILSVYTHIPLKNRFRTLARGSESAKKKVGSSAETVGSLRNPGVPLHIYIIQKEGCAKIIIYNQYSWPNTPQDLIHCRACITTATRRLTIVKPISKFHVLKAPSFYIH